MSGISVCGLKRNAIALTISNWCAFRETTRIMANLVSEL